MNANIANNANPIVVVRLRDTSITMSNRDATIEGAPRDWYEMIEVADTVKALNPVSLTITESVDLFAVKEILRNLDLGNNNTLRSLTLKQLWQEGIQVLAQELQGNITLTSLNIDPLLVGYYQDGSIVKDFSPGTEGTYAENIHDILLNNRALNSFAITLPIALYEQNQNQARFGNFDFNDVNLVEANIVGNCVEVELIAPEAL